MSGKATLSAGTAFLIASGLFLATPDASLAADAGAGETLSIGFPSDEADDPMGRSMELDDEDGSAGGPTIGYNIGQFSLRGGRINPAVGLFWDQARPGGVPGVAGGSPDPHGVSVSASVRFDPKNFGSHRLTGGTSFLDLSSFGGVRGPQDIPDPAHDRGALGTDSSAFNVTLEGSRFPLAPDLSYRIGYYQRPGSGSSPTGTESGFTAGIANRFDLGAGLSLTPSVEAGRVSDQEASDRNLVGASMLTEWRNWNLVLNYSRRDDENSAMSLIDNYDAGASIGYVFDSGITADIGWERQKRAEEIADHIGFQFKYHLNFGN